ncbi:MAG: glycosyltransferase [Anaerolineae bacterium]|nr:glycosyltransferase [Anaerolineae bacterium]
MEHQTKLLMATTVATTLRAFLLPFARHFREQGWQVDALAQGVSTNTDCVANFDRVWEVTWSRDAFSARNFAPARQIQDLARQEGYQIVHVHTPVASFVTRFALRRLRRKMGIKVIYTAHGFHFYQGGATHRNLVFLALEKLAGRWTDYLVVLNSEDRLAAGKHRLVPENRICYMPGIGVDIAKYDPKLITQNDVEALRDELGLTPAGHILLMIAEFIPRKRHADVLRAFQLVNRPETHLALAGRGPDLATMKELAETLGIQTRVHFLGYRRDIPVLLRAADVTLLTSSQEGLPRSVMESLCLETPVIGTDIRGTRDLVGTECGLLVPVGDIEGLAKAMTWMLEHPEQAREMGRRGRERMASYDQERIVALHEKLYAHALAGEGLVLT